MSLLLEVCCEEGNEGHADVSGWRLREQRFVQSDISFKIKFIIFLWQLLFRKKWKGILSTDS